MLNLNCQHGKQNKWLAAPLQPVCVNGKGLKELHQVFHFCPVTCKKCVHFLRRQALDWLQLWPWAVSSACQICCSSVCCSLWSEFCHSFAITSILALLMSQWAFACFMSSFSVSCRVCARQGILCGTGFSPHHTAGQGLCKANRENVVRQTIGSFFKNVCVCFF